MGPFMAKEDEEYHKNIIEEINYQCIQLNVKKMLLKVTNAVKSNTFAMQHSII